MCAHVFPEPVPSMLMPSVKIEKWLVILMFEIAVCMLRFSHNQNIELHLL